MQEQKSNGTWHAKALPVTMAPINMYRFFTGKVFGALIMGTLTLYFFGVTVENYWMVIPTMPGAEKGAFMPKPFINDKPDWGRLTRNWNTPTFIVAFILCLAVQLLQATALRARSSTKGFNTSERELIALAKSKAQGSRILLMLLCYVIDFYTAWLQYPLIGIPGGQFVPNLAWFIFSLFGTEMSANTAIALAEDVKEGRIED